MTEQPEPSERPPAVRTEVDSRSLGFMTQAEKNQRVEAEARRLGESDVRAILRAVEAEGPVGRFILKLLRLPTKGARRGRPRHQGETADHMAYVVVSNLRRSGMAAADAYREAPAQLAKRGVFEPGSRRKLASQAIVKASCRRESDQVKRWFEPPSAE